MSAGTSNAGSHTVNSSTAHPAGSVALPTNPNTTSTDVLSQSKDVQTMISVLKDMGIEEFEPRVINQLLEFSYRYITNLLEDAKAFSNHAAKKTIDSEDIKMAIKSKVDYSFTTTPPRDLLMEISKAKNKNPLPPIKYHAGIRLPPDRFCLHAQNYTLKHHEVISESEQMVAPGYSYVNQNTIPQSRAFKVQNNMQTSSSLTRNDSSSSFMPANLSIKRPRADEDDYDC